MSIGTYCYSSYTQAHKKKRTYLDTSNFSDHFSNFIKEKNLVVPDFYHKIKAGQHYQFLLL